MRSFGPKRRMGVCPEWPGHRPINDDAREENTMNSGMSEQVATLRDQQLVARVCMSRLLPACSRH